VNKIRFGGALALSLLLAACGKNQNAEPDDRQASNSAPAPAPTAQAYSASGEITAIAGDEVTIAHGPVEGLGWPAMTMSFKAASPELLSGVSVGDQVSFAFTQDGGAYTLTSLSEDR